MGKSDFGGREQHYYQLYNILFHNIVSGCYPLGSLIPAESELMKQYMFLERRRVKQWRC